VSALESGGRAVAGVVVAVLTGTALNSEAPGAVYPKARLKPLGLSGGGRELPLPDESLIQLAFDLVEISLTEPKRSEARKKTKEIIPARNGRAAAGRLGKGPSCTRGQKTKDYETIWNWLMTFCEGEETDKGRLRPWAIARSHSDSKEGEFNGVPSQIDWVFF
jgi:hypothetical protein